MASGDISEIYIFEYSQNTKIKFVSQAAAAGANLLAAVINYYVDNK